MSLLSFSLLTPTTMTLRTPLTAAERPAGWWVGLRQSTDAVQRTSDVAFEVGDDCWFGDCLKILKKVLTVGSDFHISGER